MKKYLAILHSNRDGLSGYFLDIPTTLFAGDTLEEALEDAVEALSATQDCLISEGKDLPEPSSLEDWDLEDGITVVIPVE